MKMNMDKKLSANEKIILHWAPDNEYSVFWCTASTNQVSLISIHVHVLPFYKFLEYHSSTWVRSASPQ